MTSFEKWLTVLVDVLAYGPEQARDPAMPIVRNPELEIRIACGLIQARALECRAEAGEIAIKGNRHPIALGIHRWLTERSHEFEQIGMKIGEPGGWPIQDNPEPPEIVRVM